MLFHYVSLNHSLTFTHLTVELSEHIATLLVRFALANKEALPYGWAPRILVQCGVPFTEIWDVFHDMYESQVRHVPEAFFIEVELTQTNLYD